MVVHNHKQLLMHFLLPCVQTGFQHQQKFGDEMTDDTNTNSNHNDITVEIHPMNNLVASLTTVKGLAIVNYNYYSLLLISTLRLYKYYISLHFLTLLLERMVTNHKRVAYFLQILPFLNS
jgi:hypothetical protein